VGHGHPGAHLKGTFGPTRHAAAYWRDRYKAGAPVDARVINTTSPSGLFGNIGQTNYGAAKAGIATFSIIAANELSRYCVTVNAIAPTALTRMTEDLASMQTVQQQESASGFDSLAPENISPLVVSLGSALSRAVTGRAFTVLGARISVNEGWGAGPTIERRERWMPGELTEASRVWWHRPRLTPT
jgi:NAD(P)-dependent dehydrogenase (short-subunit alcohol dehydrogenase family)